MLNLIAVLIGIIIASFCAKVTHELLNDHEVQCGYFLWLECYI